MRYSDTLVDHFLHPRHAGMMRDPDGVGEAEYADCGDLTRFFLKTAAGVVADVRFQTYGCGPTIAAASAASELVAGRPLAEVAALEALAVERALDGLPDDRRHAAEIAAEALRAAARACLTSRTPRAEAEGGSVHAA